MVQLQGRGLRGACKVAECGACKLGREVRGACKVAGRGGPLGGVRSGRAEA